MRLQPNRDYVSNDNIQTPLALARRLVAHFAPSGRILEPCSGDGNFLRALRAHARVHNARNGFPRRSKPSAVVSKTSVPSLNFQPSTLNSPRGTSVAWCEVQRRRDFFAWNQPIDWIITNPPWSQIRRFLQHAMAHADHVVFLCTINHVWTRARLRDIRSAGFGLREIVIFDTPRSFPQLGFQLGAVFLARGWTGPITLTDWTPAEPVDGPTVGRSEPVNGNRLSGNRTLTRPKIDRIKEELRALNRHLDALLPK